MSEETNFYVYVYIDPRNFEEFYYGKGKGNRKSSHLDDDADSEKVKRIKAIRACGEEPIIKVIATNLTGHDALLIEKTLLWKLGRHLTNVSSGYFSEKFRPHNTFHQELHGFDYQNGIYLVNVGEGKHRSWDDCRKYGFLSAGQGEVWRREIQRLRVGDVVVAYLKRKSYRGYVGIGVVIEPAVMARDFRLDSKRLDELELICGNILDNANDPEKSEYPVRIHWKVTVDAEEAKWKRNENLFSYRKVVATLDNQKKTIEFIASEFGINLYDLLT